MTVLDMSAGNDAAPHIPFAEVNINALLPPPVAPSMVESGSSTPRDSYAASQTPGTPTQSARLLQSHDVSNGIHQSASEKTYLKKKPTIAKNRKSFRVLFFCGFLSFLVVVLAVVLPVYFFVIRPNQHHNNAAAQGSPAGPGSTSTPGQNPSSVSSSITGGNGSLITTSDGSTLTYNNPFGGYWVSDPSDPYNTGARPQSWVPALNESWTFGKDLIHGCELIRFSVCTD